MFSMTPVILLCGVAGAGKTTYARSLEPDGYVRVSYDEEMWALGGDSADATPELLAEADRHVRARIRASVLSGNPVVLDASMSTRAIRDDLRAFVREVGGTPRLVVLDAPFGVLAARVSRRRDRADANAHYLDEGALRRFHTSFEFPGPDEPHTRIVTA
jgi:predicted kinase